MTKNEFFSKFIHHLQKVSHEFYSIRLGPSPLPLFDRMSSWDCFYFDHQLKEISLLLERPTKRNRILDFFRGRGRASERNDVHSKDRNHSHVTLVDKTSMK